MPFSPHGPGRITVARAHRLLRDGTAVLVDVREADEYRAGHAPGALFVPLSHLAAGAAAVPDGKDLVLICRSGNRSRQAAALLAERGVAAVDVIGGMLDWAAGGLPVQDAHGAAGTVV
ncbi:rhodanese-like domain-containing protein [Streptomyces luteolifulvus]|uniref:Rhodanese-like domain-containing protein n=1 Tax=Streptomyces luteolifulvus TaxID=2615112 RepID=A0A6H9UPQ4_9ACTN|nr:rhodanese-like domain-containing protein [Streptomyces luteolifulvus]KAB1139915.1 rhodanese-like domain-containing protein [Streptomyces luteolifulvus]